MQLAREKKDEIDAIKPTSKTELAKALGVSRSSLYYQPKRPAIDKEIKGQIEAVLVEHPAYGHKRIALELKLNKKRIRRVMKKFNLKPYRRRCKRPVKKDDLGKLALPYKNEIKGICPKKPNFIWVSDFTYLRFGEKFIYLATVMDLFTREIVGWNISRYHNQYLVIGALLSALTRNKAAPIYLHSDQGSEYESIEYILKCQEHHIIISMSAKASPWENNFQESFYSQFKVDLGRTDRFDIIGELIEAIHATIHYYNQRRIHTSLRMPPQAFKEQYLNNISLKDVDKTV